MMTTESEFSDDDLQLITASQLGTPLAVYRLKPGHARFLRWVGLFIFLVGIVTLVFTIILFFKKRPVDALDIIVALLPSLYAIFQGGLLYSL